MKRDLVIILGVVYVSCVMAAYSAPPAEVRRDSVWGLGFGVGGVGFGVWGLGVGVGGLGFGVLYCRFTV